jgi:phospholipid/cholesterol/gamma-HCH transport system substrate-binding protein
MKFRIRFADQIVGIFIIIALVSLALVIVLLGTSQRWFSRDSTFYTEFSSASGISKNMPLLYKGFTIGNIKDFSLNEQDSVTVVFIVRSEYRDRVKQGSMVEIMVSPIGLGNQFLFYPGKGVDLIPEGNIVHSVNSPMAQQFFNQGLAEKPERDDSISVLLSRVNGIMDGVNQLIPLLDEALRTGTDATTLGQIIGGVNRTIAGVETLPNTVNDTVDTLVIEIDKLMASLNGVLKGVDPILSDLNVVTSSLSDPEGTVSSILDSNGEVYAGLVDAIKSLTGILDSLDQTVAFVPRQLPQLAILIMDLQAAMKSANDLMVALTNNPLLRGGVPERMDIQTSVTSPRDIRF